MSEKDIHFGNEFLNDERTRLINDYGFTESELTMLENWLDETIGYKTDSQKAAFMNTNAPDRIKEIIGGL